MQSETPGTGADELRSLLDAHRRAVGVRDQADHGSVDYVTAQRKVESIAAEIARLASELNRAEPILRLLAP